MNRKQRIEFNWKSALGAIALTAVASGINSSPARASSESNLEAESFEIAQVGVRSRINSTPLNLRPRTHIPLPTTSRSRDRYRHRGYYPQQGRYNRRDRYGYGHHHDCNHHHGHHRRRKGGTVIIINPGSYSNYNYTDTGGSIRVIRK